MRWEVREAVNSVSGEGGRREQDKPVTLGSVSPIKALCMFTIDVLRLSVAFFCCLYVRGVLASLRRVDHLKVDVLSFVLVKVIADFSNLLYAFAADKAVRLGSVFSNK